MPPKVLTIDNLSLARVQLLLEPASGPLQVYAEYHLRAGPQVVQTVHREITADLPAGRLAALAALLQSLGQDLTAAEGLA